MTLWDLYRAGQWLRPPKPPEGVTHDALRTRVKTEFSNTVFAGEPEAWEAYLNMAREDRYVRNIHLAILWDDNARFLLFRPETPDSQPLARALNGAYAVIADSAHEQDHVGPVFDELIFGNKTNGGAALNLYLSAALPSDVTREVRFDEALHPMENNIVVQSDLVRDFLDDTEALLDAEKPTRLLGVAWPLMQGILSKLARSSAPRDDFVERIDVTTKMCLLAINLLFKDVSKRKLIPNKAGELFEKYHSKREDIERSRLYERHPYFRLLNELRFFITEKGCRHNQDIAQVLVREYLDQCYLRLSLAGVMPDPTQAMLPMDWSWVKKRKIATPSPVVGRYGIQDADDLAAWKKVGRAFDEMGFTLVRQLGIGQFGRVYDAVNRENPHIPQFVALKVDRIQRGQKKQAIQAAEITLNTARDLARSPHVIRIYDAGKLSGKKYTYHILQRVDGETLDHLAGVAGVEHASFHGPRGRVQDQTLPNSYAQALAGAQGEAWRGARLTASFTEPLSLSHCLDLITSMLLWVEEIHQIGYAINDLKNGNLMISRRGQLKGIDLDSYEPATLPEQRTPDFVFLAVTLVLLLFNVRRAGANHLATDGSIIKDSKALREAINAEWSYGDVHALSGGRIQQSDIVDLFVELVQGCRDHRFAFEPDAFSEFIDRFMFVKRLTFLDEMVLD